MTHTEILKNDVLRYKKNSLPAKLALLGLVQYVIFLSALWV